MAARVFVTFPERVGLAAFLTGIFSPPTLASLSGGGFDCKVKFPICHPENQPLDNGFLRTLILR